MRRNATLAAQYSKQTLEQHIVHHLTHAETDGKQGTEDIGQGRSSLWCPLELPEARRQT